METKHSYGLIPQKPDQRDFMFAPKAKYVFPPSIDMRPKCPPVYDQGQLGSCTANGGGFAYEYAREKQGLKDFMPSRLFIYYNERKLEHTINSDSGASVRDCFKAMNKYGVCPETDWPYDISKFTDKPSKQCYDEAKKDLVLKYKSLRPTMDDLKSCLFEGFPIPIGIAIYDSFETNEVAKTGVVPIPKQDETLLGFHCVAVVGYEDSESSWIVRNSWGKEWGDGGYFYLPYRYLLDVNLASDFWQLSLVS